MWSKEQCDTKRSMNGSMLLVHSIEKLDGVVCKPYQCKNQVKTCHNVRKRKKVIWLPPSMHFKPFLAEYIIITVHTSLIAPRTLIKHWLALLQRKLAFNMYPNLTWAMILRTKERIFGYPINASCLILSCLSSSNTHSIYNMVSRNLILICFVFTRLPNQSYLNFKGRRARWFLVWKLGSNEHLDDTTFSLVKSLVNFRCLLQGEAIGQDSCWIKL